MHGAAIVAVARRLEMVVVTTGDEVVAIVNELEQRPVSPTDAASPLTA